MSTPSSPARGVRGGAIGVFSVLTATSAHASGGGGVPQGSALVTALLGCLIAGAVVGQVGWRTRGASLLAVVVALCVGQALSHVIFAVTGHHHAGAGTGISMVAAHAVAAVALGALICAAEYLCVVGASVLSWLRVFAATVTRPVCRSIRRTRSHVTVRARFRPSALGTRAPPLRLAL